MPLRFLFFVCINALCWPCTAQLNVDEVLQVERRFCTPGIMGKSRSRGVEIRYSRLPRAPLHYLSGKGYTPETIEGIKQLSYKIKLPLVNQPDWKVLLGFAYQPETVIFDSSQEEAPESIFHDMHATGLKRSSIGLYAIKVVDDNEYFGFTAKLSQSGDFDQLIHFGGEYRAINLNLARAFKVSEDFEWGYGIAFSSNFRRTLALPFIIYNRNFSKAWGIEALFPGYINLRHNIGTKTILLGGYQFNSRNYAISKDQHASDAPVHYHLNHSEIQFGFTLEQEIVPWVWFDVQAGYQFNFDTRLEAQVTEFSSYRVRPGHSPYFSLSVFISPPR